MLTTDWNVRPLKRSLDRQGWESGRVASVSGSMVRAKLLGSQFPDRLGSTLGMP